MSEQSDDAIFRVLRPIDEHPIPFDQEEINERWDGRGTDRDPPGVDEAHTEYADTIAECGEWHVFRPMYPFGHGDVVFWSRESGEAFRVDDSEGRWHALVNLFAEIVDAEGDCRDADYSDSLTPSGSYDQRCEDCGDSWVVG